MKNNQNENTEKSVLQTKRCINNELYTYGHAKCCHNTKKGYNQKSNMKTTNIL